VVFVGGAGEEPDVVGEAEANRDVIVQYSRSTPVGRRLHNAVA
jgi:hypothetical protein